MPDERTYHVIADDKVKTQSMTREEILAAIVQAVETHEIADVDTGFITTIQEGNRNAGLKFWVGTSAEYNAIPNKEHNCFYILTDENDIAEVVGEIEGLQDDLDNLSDTVSELSTTVGSNTSRIEELENSGGADIASIQLRHWREDTKASLVLLNQVVQSSTTELSIPFAVNTDTIHTPPEIFHIDDFKHVKVYAQNHGFITCDVFEGENAGEYMIRGASSGEFSQNNATRLILIYLVCDSDTNSLIYNRTKRVTLASGAYGVAEIDDLAITKIVGVD